MFKEAIINQIRELYLKGNTADEIRQFMVKKYGIIYCTEIFRRKIKEMSITRSNSQAITNHYRRKQPIHAIIKSYNQGRPIRELSQKFSIARNTIKKIIKEENIPIRDSRSSLLMMGHIKEKKKFNLSLKEKAYIFGLVMGDLTPVKKSEYTLKLITHTTHPAFAELLQKTFEKYGIANYKLNKNNEFRFQTHLDLESFFFLLDTKIEKIPCWINDQNFFDFLAGFIDSDGSVMTKKNGIYFQFVIRFYGENLSILKEIKQRLTSLEYSLSIHKNHKKGDMSYYQGKRISYNRDYYTLEVYKKDQTIDLLKLLSIRHPEKILGKRLIFKIEKSGMKRWIEVEKEIKAVRAAIDRSVQLQTQLKL